MIALIFSVFVFVISLIFAIYAVIVGQIRFNRLKKDIVKNEQTLQDLQQEINDKKQINQELNKKILDLYEVKDNN